VKKVLSYIIIFSFIIIAFLAMQESNGNFSLDFLNDSDDLKIHFIDIGQGDSSLIITPNKKTILIDTGTKSSSNILIEYLKRQGVDTIDVLVSTHPHSDHIGGAVDIMDNFKVNQVLDSGFVHTSKTYENYLEKIDEKDIPFSVVKSGDTFNLDGLNVKILNPLEPKEDANNSSIVMRVEYGDFSCLFTGDIEEKSEIEIINNNHFIQSVVLKVAHHGSDTSSSQIFLEKVMPDVSIIEVGKDNPYGHPSKRVLDRLNIIKTEVFRTDLDGTIIIKSDGVNYSVSTSK